MPNQSTAVAVVEQPKAIAVIRTELEARERDLLEVLPPGMDAKRFMRVSLIAISKNPDLLKCSGSSIIRSVIEAAEIGLEPTGSLNRAWLVPFKGEATLMVGYQGYADLMRDSGHIVRVTTEVVYEGDEFRVVKGSNPTIIHEPAYATEDPLKITHAYAIAWFRDGGSQFEVMTKKQIDLIRAKSKQANGPAWTQGYPQMARKCPLRRLANYMPLSDRTREAIAKDDEREFGPAAPAEPVQTKAATLKDRIKGNRKAATPENGPGADEKGEADTSASEKSADQQTGENETTDAETREVCGAAGAGLAEGEVCVLAPDHGGMVHKSDNASWPV
jgi:recombination protein RecT